SDGALTSFFEHLVEDAAVPKKKSTREPEETIQSRADEETGGAIWKRLVTPAKPGVKVYAAVGASVAVLSVVLAVLMSLLGGGDEGEPAEGKGVAAQSKTTSEGQSGRDGTPPAVIPRGEDLPTVGSVRATLRATLTDFSGPVTSLAFGPNGQKLATNGNGRGILAAWDAAEGEEIVSQRAHDEGVWGIDFADNGKKVAAGTYKRATIWTLDVGMNHLFRGQPSTIHSVAFAPGSGQLATACSGKTIWMWDVATAEPVWKIADAASYDDLDFSPDGRLLVSCGYDAMVRLWDAATGDPVAVLEGHGGRVLAVSFTHDGRQIASASDDNTVRIWDVAGRKTLLTLDHPDKVHAVSFSRLDNVVASGCEDGKVRLWDAATGELSEALDDHTGPVRCVKFAPRGNLLASGGDDRTVHVWEAKIIPRLAGVGAEPPRRERGSPSPAPGVSTPLAQQGQQPSATRAAGPDGEADSQVATGQADAARMVEIEKQQQIEQRYAEAIRPAEELVAAWNFRGALTALGEVEFEEQDLAARLDVWREGIEHLVDLKARIIAKINAAEPRLKKSDLMIRGVGGEVAEANEDGITAELSRGKTESLAWQDVGLQAVDKLVRFGAEEQNPDDWLAAGVLALAYHDIPLAEALFGHARSVGADISPYLNPLAAVALSRARQLVEAEAFSEADALLTNLEAKYADTAWFASNRGALEAMRAEAKAGVYEAEAETLYAAAVGLFEREQLFDVKPLVEQLKADYANSLAVAVRTRKPSFAELEKAVAELGRFITVRQNGKGDFTGIQAAIDAAPPNSLIEIEDTGPYSEQIVFGASKTKIALRGKEGAWPLIASLDQTKAIETLITVESADTLIQEVILVHSAPSGRSPHCVFLRGYTSSLRLRSTLVWSKPGQNAIQGDWQTKKLDVQNSLILGNLRLQSGSLAFANSLILAADHAGMHFPSRIECCTIPSTLMVGKPQSVVSDSIVGTVVQEGRGDPGEAHTFENCNVFAASLPGGAKNSFRVAPQFRDPANLDYRLLPTSPCIGKASDGGDIGCRYTPEMIEMVQKALELRAQGIIKF
ncbi:MAG: hypothetical protein HQ582_17705, partial [Planctomycetes bacterium]|nr:hypothetical protein [Planctomycetota bacterium]